MPVRVIAEAGQCSGSVTYAREAIDAAARAGCWALKVQLLSPEGIAVSDAPIYWDDQRPDVVTDQRAAFRAAGCLPYDCLEKLKAEADAHEIELVASPFDLKAVDAMGKAGLRWAKIASGDITNRDLIEAAAENHLIILSTGASTWPEIARAIGWTRGKTQAVLACSLVYPTPLERAEIARVHTLAGLRDRFGDHWDIGYSDHTHGIEASTVAVAAGARYLEKHFTLDSDDVTVADNAFALEPGWMAAYVSQAHTAERILGNGSLEVNELERRARRGARRSLYAARDLPAGHRLGWDDVVALRPFSPDGFEPGDIDLVLGRRSPGHTERGALIRNDAFR